jgi:hypothetical protein
VSAVELRILASDSAETTGLVFVEHSFTRSVKLWNFSEGLNDGIRFTRQHSCPSQFHRGEGEGVSHFLLLADGLGGKCRIRLPG